MDHFRRFKNSKIEDNKGDLMNYRTAENYYLILSKFQPVWPQ